MGLFQELPQAQQLVGHDANAQEHQHRHYPHHYRDAHDPMVTDPGPGFGITPWGSRTRNRKSSRGKERKRER